jgi:hypothetical protein
MVRVARSWVGVERCCVGVRDWCGQDSLHWDDHFLEGWRRVRSVPRLLDDSVEARVFVSRIVYSADRTVRFDKLVVAFDLVTFTFLRLLLDVTSVIVFDSVLEFVMGWGLELLEDKLLAIKI